MEVSDIMNEVYTIDENVSLSKAAQIMVSKKTGALVFVNGSKIAGIITEDDLVRNFNKNKNVKDIMATKVVTIEEDENIDRALELMNNHGVKRLPVLSKNGKLIGMINIIDIARHAEELEEDFFFE